MKQLWERLASRIDGYGLRERILIFLMLAVLLISVLNVTMLDEQSAKDVELSRQIAQDQSQIAGMQAEITGMVASYRHQQDPAKLAELQQLKTKSAQMHAALQDLQKGLVTPDKMAALLEDLLKQNGKLKLVSLRTLPVSTLGDSEPPDAKATPDKSATNESAHVGGMRPAGLVYKHGVEVVIEGDYFEMVNYMSALEHAPWRLFWGKAKLSADDSSRLSLSLTLYTLSLDKEWLNI